MTGLLQKLHLLFWKNLIHLKRQYVVTTCEIVLPTLFVLVLAYIRSQVKPISNDFDYNPPGDRTYYEYSEQEMIRQLSYNLEGYTNSYIAYVPKLNETHKIVQGLVDAVREQYPLPPYQNERVKLIGFDLETELEQFQASLLLDIQSPYLAFGIVFDGISDDKYSQTISYKIRTDSFYDTKNLLPADYLSDLFSFYGNRYYSSFLGIQLVIDKLLIRNVTGKEPFYKISSQAFPDPEHKEFDLADLYKIFVPVFIITGFVFIVPTIVRGVVSEKETGIKELMKMSGLPEWMHWLGWMMNSLLVLLITITIIVVVLFVPFNSEAGAVFKHSDPTLFWIVMLIYSIWATTYCFAISAFFERPALGTTAGIVIWLVCFYGLGLTMEVGYGEDFSLGLKLFLCLFPNVGFNLALNVICTLEAAEKGAKWGNIAEPINSVNSLTLLYPLLIMFASMILNMIICLYFEAVLPKNFGVRKPLYFIFLPSEWGFGGKTKESEKPVLESSSRLKPVFEEDPSELKAGVEIRNLRKQFGKGVVAVNDISVNMFEGQIFCLLGENGAGKTTTMSMLTGLFAPTSGTAFINGYNIRTDMAKIRENLGLCPQHNMLFDKMTVFEHLKFFGMLKGLSSQNAEKEAVDFLALLQIHDKKDALSMNLSGGQKRRLSLGCSIVGGSKVVFLDEPTSGMDPEARRAIWDILLRLRENRIIVLTTHFMEEADVLGDRIAIMASGAMICCGSPNFLKRYYGAGYTLSMTIQSGADRERILATVERHIADASFKSSHSNNESELSIVLPSDSKTSSSFPELFAELNRQQIKLGIAEIGVGWTTMDEVFVRVEELSHKDREIESTQETPVATKNLERVEGLPLLFSQFSGLLTKKVLWTIRRKRLILSQMIIPVLLTIAAVAISRTAYSNNDRTPPLKLTLSPYKNPITLYAAKDGGIGNLYAASVGSSAKAVSSRYNGDVSAALLDVGKNDIVSFREQHIIAAEINSTNMKAMHSNVAQHSSPVALNAITNTLLRLAATSQNNIYKIETINHPFRSSLYELLKPLQEDPDYIQVIAYVFGILVPIGLVLLAGSFLISPTEERLNKGKQLQLMTGVNPLLYWGSTYICDFVLMLVTICLMTACIPIFESHQNFTNHNGAGVLILLLVLYSAATLSFSYIFSTFVRSVAGGFTLITVVHLLTGIGLGLASIILESLTPGSGGTIAVNILGRLFPSFALTKGSIYFAKVASGNSKCKALSDEAISILCTPLFSNSSYNDYGVSQECCENCKDLGDGECFEPTPFFQWTKKVCEYEAGGKLVCHNLPSFTQDLVWLALIAAVYAVILMLVEYDIFKMIVEKVVKQKAASFQRTVNDVDVIDENTRIAQLVAEGQISSDALVVNNLCKSFGIFSAVSSLSFGVHHGECFGLLGVNGAGKTTTFRMLTGDETRSSGNAFMENLSLEWGRKAFLSKLGYCPQFDGIVGVLTGREMLSLFAKLRGIPNNLIAVETMKWLEKTGLWESGDVQCQKYSGGMKRRLSAAVALIGDPPLILLDEPTSGVDPVARRQFWRIISSIKNSGQAIILTSHSMEECEAVCSRLGIMVNGEMQCIGPVQHLKNKFAQGYSLTIKLKQISDLELTNVVVRDVLESFTPCSLKDHHQTTMKFQIHSQARGWEDLYRMMERIKDKNQECIDEYAITETTLEEVFLSFARTQYTNERVTTDGNCLRRMC